MVLRLIAILVFILIVLRAVARFLIGASRRGSAGGARATAGPRAPRNGAQPRRQLLQCRRCGTYFEDGRGLPEKIGGTEIFCSQSCVVDGTESAQA